MKVLALPPIQATVPLAAEATAQTFYPSVLSLSEIPKPKSLLKNGGFWCLIGDHQLHLGVEEGLERKANKADVAYVVDDLAGWRAYLQAAGIKIQESTPIPGIERFEFRDPFGNRIEMLQTQLAELPIV